ncbi:long-chain-fatty-acid--CoA ligase [Tichowtungia aerotolerans]|uniref:Long-chain-fatty-acid--CoA ligase n=1 Tax=Tichowtungia aerotolerans TaxID=2697043 RepID=A0A6P1M736_9BACT|nr:long-chain fatty acid--CoA ligase [Tichowtungia aerotolerans]QHI69661.1 long-chain-fatty-acid--CoA ligase [Tichowtungia aerotolerans]
MNTETIPFLFRKSAEAHADKPAVVTPQKSVTYAELNQMSDAIAANLIERGTQPGDHVGLYGINSAEFIAIYFGIQKAGATVVPINLLLNPEEVAWILNDAGVKTLFYFEPFTPAVESIREKLPTIGTFIGVEQELPQMLRTPIPGLELPISSDSVAVIIYTSGTTGHPKGAMLTHRNLCFDALSAGNALKLRPDGDRFLVVLPMFHAFASLAGVLIPLLHGSSLVPLPKFDPTLTAETIDATNATIFLGVPSMYNLLLRLPEKHTAHIQKLRFAVSGGAAMPVEIMKQFEERFGVFIIEGDGPTECAPVTCFNPVDGLRKPQSVGLPIPGVEMKIMDEHGKELPLNEPGEICVRGPNVMKGYWKQPEETAESFFGEWFRTGDIGTEDEDGYFYIVDRIKDMVIVNGMNVYPRVVEEVLYKHEAVREAAVIGEPSKLHGEVPVAYISLKDGFQCSEKEIRAFCLEHLGRHEVPKKVHLVGDLPKNAAGKIVKRELRKQGEIERGIETNEH